MVREDKAMKLLRFPACRTISYGHNEPLADVLKRNIRKLLQNQRPRDALEYF